MWRFLVMCKIWSENELPALKIMFTPDHYLLWLIPHYILLVHILQSIYSIHVLVLNITWHRTKWTKNAENASYNTCQNKFFGYVPNFTTDWASNITREFPSSCPVVQLSNCPGFLSSHLECEAFMNWMQVTAPSLLYSFYLYITFLTQQIAFSVCKKSLFWLKYYKQVRLESSFSPSYAMIEMEIE